MSRFIIAVRASCVSEARSSHQTAPQIPHIGGAFPVTWWYAIIEQKLSTHCGVCGCCIPVTSRDNLSKLSENQSHSLRGSFLNWQSSRKNYPGRVMGDWLQ